jgi:hypothetical protein
MSQKHRELENITNEDERLTYFENVVLPEMDKLEQKEQRTWDEHHADFDLDILERGFGSEDNVIIIPKMIVEACGLRKADINDIIFSKNPADIHHLVSDRNLCRLLDQCTDHQKELLFYIDIHNIDGAEIARATGVNPRNITSVHARTIEHIRTQLLPLILFKFKLEHSNEWQSVARERLIYTTYEERFFCATMGKDYLEYWENPYFEGVNFNLTPITEHHNAEPKRK